MIPWSNKEKEVLLKEDTSTKAIEKYYEAFPRSNREKSSLYTYWWWRKREEKKAKARSKTTLLPIKVGSKPVEKTVKKSADVVKRDIEQVHATIVEFNKIPNFEMGDSVRYARGSVLLSPIGVVINVEKKRGIPMKSQKMKVRFDNYNVREVYCCDYIIVMKGGKR